MEMEAYRETAKREQPKYSDIFLLDKSDMPGTSSMEKAENISL